MSKKMIVGAISAVIAMGLAGTAITAKADNSPSMQDMMKGEMKGMEKCYGVVKAGMNDCGTVGHSCAGEAKKDGDKNEWVGMPNGLCDKIVGGSTKMPSST